jgi:hypothetical protein
MRISNATLILLHNAIAALDAGFDVTVDGKNAKRPYKYGAVVHGPLQFAATAIKPHVEAFQKANKAIFAQHAETYTGKDGEAAQRIPAKVLAEWQHECTELLEQTVSVKLYQIKLSELKVGTGDGENPIPKHVLGDLGRVLVNDLTVDQMVEIADDEPANDAPADDAAAPIPFQKKARKAIAQAAE